MYLAKSWHGLVLVENPPRTLRKKAIPYGNQSCIPNSRNINYLRPITDKTGVLYSTGNVIQVGGRVATAEGRLTDADGKLYAHGTTTCIILKPT